MGIVFGRIGAETPPSTLLRKTAVYEIRSYGAQVAAVYTPPPGTSKSAGSAAFRGLAGYYGIGAAPQQAAATPEPIAMTAPVLMDYGARVFDGDGGADDSGGGWADAMERMSFLLPAKYASAADAPPPASPSVHLVDVPPRTAAVRVFSGNLSLEAIRREAAVLRRALEEDGVTVADGETPRVAGYNPPFTVPFLKTNEIQVGVVPETVPAGGDGAEAAAK